MFDLFPNLLSSIPTFLFPVFASYKALKTSDPALLTPWLMYWVVLAIALFVESWVGWFLVWVPFYGWFRLAFLLYLILPQTQGARVMYQKYVHPWLQENENSIDRSISDIHDKVKHAGGQYVEQLIELVKQYAFGIQPKPKAPPPATYTSYAQSLISQFNLPSARPQQPAHGSGSSGTAGDFYSLLASAVTAATGSSSNVERNRDLSNSGTLIPPNVNGSDRLNFISTQRDRLTTLLSALDREASTLQQQNVRSRVPSFGYDGSDGSDGLSTRKSEPDFERIDTGVDQYENGRRQVQRGHSASGSWMPWSWGGNKPSGDDHGRSTGLEY